MEIVWCTGLLFGPGLLHYYNMYYFFCQFAYYLVVLFLFTSMKCHSHTDKFSVLECFF